MPAFVSFAVRAVVLDVEGVLVDGGYEGLRVGPLAPGAERASSRRGVVVHREAGCAFVVLDAQLRAMPFVLHVWYHVIQ